jgi:hypothetical protein
LLASSRAAAADGPKTAIPASRRRSATPFARGTSGPTTTRSTPCSRARPTIAAVSSAFTSGKQSAIRAMPSLPGAASSFPTSGLRAIFHTSACSRPPDPTTSSFIAR